MKPTSETIIRTIILAFALINQILTIFGLNPLPIAETELYNILSMAATIITTVWSWWKNNSFTEAAIKADKYMHGLKEE